MSGVTVTSVMFARSDVSRSNLASALSAMGFVSSNSPSSEYDLTEYVREASLRFARVSQLLTLRDVVERPGKFLFVSTAVLP